FAAIWVSIIFGVMATEPHFAQLVGGRLAHVDKLILAGFAVEYFARLATAGLSPQYRGVRGLVRYAMQPASIADLIVIIPILFPTPPTWMLIFRLLRILRLLRLASMPHIHQAISEFYEALAAKRFELMFTLCLGVILILVSSTSLYLIERNIQPEVFGSIPRAVWWSVVTFTTVGYGDAIPVTSLGRIFAGVYAISGLGLVAMLTGVIASALSEAAELHSRNKQQD
ncbi:MAG: potassium channel family protein, partial [Pseudomonadota bacterium]